MGRSEFNESLTHPTQEECQIIIDKPLESVASGWDMEAKEGKRGGGWGVYYESWTQLALRACPFIADNVLETVALRWVGCDAKRRENERGEGTGCRKSLTHLTPRAG